MCLPPSGVYTQAKYTGVETFVITSDRNIGACSHVEQTGLELDLAHFLAFDYEP